MRNEFINVLTLEEQTKILSQVMQEFSEEQLVYTLGLVVDIKCILLDNIDEEHKNLVDLILDIQECGVEQVGLYGLGSVEEFDKFFEDNYTSLFYLYNQLVDNKSGKHPITYLSTINISIEVFDYIIDSIALKYCEALNSLINDILDHEEGTNNSLVRRVLPLDYRVEKGNTYYYITDRFQVYSYIDEREEVDNGYFSSGNYFRNYDDALIVAKSLENYEN